MSASLGQPIYWAGPRSGYTYEYTRNADGAIYVRDLPPGVDVGDDRANFLIIATYPFDNAFAGLEQQAHGQEIRVEDGGIVLVQASYPESVHVAFPGVDYQVEVYDPAPPRSLAEARSPDLAQVP